MKSYPRSRRVADQILREASLLLDSVLENESFGLVSVTDVTLSKDLRYARIFVSSLTDEQSRKDMLSFLSEQRKSFRTRLAQRLTLKYMPEIAFEYDPSVERGMRIESLLAEIEEKKTGTGADAETSSGRDSH